MSRLSAEGGKVDFSLYLITDRSSLPAGRELLETVRAALRGGVKAVQLREKDLSAAQLYPLAMAMRQLTWDFGAKLLINDRIDLALAVDADGVHLGGQSLLVSVARQLLGTNRLIGVSTHHLDEACLAAAAGADFVTCGPVYATASKAAYGPPLGVEALAGACAHAPCPVFALGGVTVERLSELRDAGCARIALIGGILHALDPEGAARELLQGLGEGAVSEQSYRDDSDCA